MIDFGCRLAGTAVTLNFIISEVPTHLSQIAQGRSSQPWPGEGTAGLTGFFVHILPIRFWSERLTAPFLNAHLL